MNFEFTAHAKEKMSIRKISKELVLAIISKPDAIIVQEDKEIYQSVVTLNQKKYLIRVVLKSNRIITVYKTSNLKKYYEGKI